MEKFEFSDRYKSRVEWVLSKYPSERKKSAVMPLLDLGQRQNNGWLSQAIIQKVAEMLEMPLIRVQEVATFYTMYRLSPVGKNVISVCGTTPCMLRGSEEIFKVCKDKLDLSPGETKNDVTLLEVECLGACVNAPVVQINDYYHEDLDPESFTKILDDMVEGKLLKPGSCKGRKFSEPISGKSS